MRLSWATATILLPGFCRGLSSAREHLLVRDKFLGAPAKALRRAFERRFDPPESGVLGPERFAWDVWHVPGQWSLLRSPAESYFCDFGDEEAYGAFETALRDFALRDFGCSNLSPVWLSLYTDGAFQGLHTDAWQGPWSFVYSLTDWENRGFEGGETVLLTDQVLDHWSDFESGASAEERHLTREVQPLFDRLTVFDPRYPHSVRPLRGSRDPLKGRLVLHGWFTDPAPYFDGPLVEEAAAGVISEGLFAYRCDNLAVKELSGFIGALVALDGYLGELPEEGHIFGGLVVRLQIREDGGVACVEVVRDAMKTDPSVAGGEDLLDSLREKIPALLEEARFPSADGKTEVTLPFTFE